MPIDQSVLKRDAQGCIADYPVTIRHYWSATQYTEVTAGLNSLSDANVLDPGALLDDPRVDLIAIADSFQFLPQQRDRVDLQLRDYLCKTFEIKNVMDYYDIGPTLQFTIGTPNG